MNIKKSGIAIALLGAALLSGAAYAGESNKGSLNLNEAVTIEGKTINAGQYKVEWTGNAPDVQVTISKGKETVATFPAHLTEQAVQNNVSAYGATEQANGTKELTTIFIGGKHTVLQLTQTSASQAQPSSQPSK
jgi:hypothetical protein